MEKLTLAYINASVNAEGPGEVHPDYQQMPWGNLLVSLIQRIQGSVMLICVLGVIIAAAGWGLGKATQSRAWQGVGVTAMVTCVVAAIVACNAGPLIQWATDQQM